MDMLISLSIFVCLYTIFRLYKKLKAIKNKKIISFSKNNLYSWMNLTKKERYNLSKKESASYLNKRKVLLDKIRKEYKNISKGD
tara:strand:+ start:1197 stop:1448 length:252 start_codon:yes stop_codon:yes gene_type:complete